jgi:exopolyphosphatase / guanosine-5'-triphosphate,3'-diphosphate pyrophosphatase
MGRYAAIDVGSTSVHLLVADVEGHVLEPVVDESAFAGLGEAVEARPVLGAERIRELRDLLAVATARAISLDAGAVVVVGTAPLRRAADAARAVAAAAVPLHVLTEREEALLTLIGASGGRRPVDRVAVVDIGGGSTEIVEVARDEPPAVTAVDIGAARLTGRRAPADPPTRADLRAMRADARAAVQGIAPPVAAVRVLAVGGTSDNLAKLIGSPRLTRLDLIGTLDRLATVRSAELAAVVGLRPQRARLLPAGAAILLALLERWGAEEVQVARGGLREGVVLAVEQAGRGWRDRLPALASGW